jgi:hypothetical protein
MRFGVRDQTQPIVGVIHLHCSLYQAPRSSEQSCRPFYMDRFADSMRRHHFANVNWFTFGKISLETACS